MNKLMYWFGYALVYGAYCVLCFLVFSFVIAYALRTGNTILSLIGI